MGETQWGWLDAYRRDLCGETRVSHGGSGCVGSAWHDDGWGRLDSERTGWTHRWWLCEVGVVVGAVVVVGVGPKQRS